MCWLYYKHATYAPLVHAQTGVADSTLVQQANLRLQAAACLECTAETLVMPKKSQPPKE